MDSSFSNLETDPEQHYIRSLWPPGSGSAFRMRIQILIQEAKRKEKMQANNQA
jgi:hypothetical protein